MSCLWIAGDAGIELDCSHVRRCWLSRLETLLRIQLREANGEPVMGKKSKDVGPRRVVARLMHHAVAGVQVCISVDIGAYLGQLHVLDG